MRALLTALVLLVAPVALAQSPPAGEAAANPFFQEWKTPFGVPPFDQIRTEHFLPAIEEGIARAQPRGGGDREEPGRRPPSRTRSRRSTPPGGSWRR